MNIDEKIEAAAQEFNKAHAGEGGEGAGEGASGGEGQGGEGGAGDGSGEGGSGGQPEVKPIHAIFSEVVGREFKDENEVKGWVSSLTELNNTLEQFKGENTALKGQVEELQAGVDPSKFFLNEAEQRRQVLLMKHPDKSPEILSRLVATKLEEMDPKDVLRMSLRLKHGDIIKSDEEANEQLERKYGFSLTDPDIPRAAITQIALDAKEARSELQGIATSITLPEKVDLTAARAAKAQEKANNEAALTQQWLPVFKGIGDKIPDIKVITKLDNGTEQTVLEFKVDAEYRKQVNESVEETVKALAATGHQPTDTLRDKLVNESLIKVRDRYIVKNFDTIIRTLNNAKETEFANRRANDDHNPARNRQTRPVADSKIAAQHKATEQDIVRELRGQR